MYFRARAIALTNWLDESFTMSYHTTSEIEIWNVCGHKLVLAKTYYVI